MVEEEEEVPYLGPVRMPGDDRPILHSRSKYPTKWDEFGPAPFTSHADKQRLLSAVVLDPLQQI